MTTRPKSKIGTLPVLVTISLVLCQTAATISNIIPNSRCPSTIPVVRTIIYADQCREKGIAIAPIVENGRHINIPLPLTPNTGYCGAKCNCPKWTKTCSFYNGHNKKMSQAKNVPHAIFNYKPPQVCSFHKSASCPNTRKVGIFYQIVPELHISTREFFEENDYYCFTNDAKSASNLASKRSPQYGTPAFCRHHKCSTPSTKSVLCTYYSPITTFDFHNSSIVIRTWGPTAREYFSYKPIIENSKKSYTIPQRYKGGLIVETTTTFDILEVCSSFTCIYMTNYTNETLILFPTSVVLFQYTVNLNAWKEGERIFSSTLSCPGQPICETIQCRNCWEKFFNIQCWSFFEIAASLFLLISTGLFLHAITPLFTILRWISSRVLRFPPMIARLVTNACRKLIRRHQTSEVTQATYQKKKKRRKICGIVATVILSISTAHSCSDIVTFQGQTSRCTITDNEEKCEYDEVTQLLLQPIGQDACLLLKNKENRVTATVAIRLHQISHICKQKTEYFTRDHHFLRSPFINATTPEVARKKYAHQSNRKKGFLKLVLCRIRIRGTPIVFPVGDVSGVIGVFTANHHAFSTDAIRQPHHLQYTEYSHAHMGPYVRLSRPGDGRPSPGRVMANRHAELCLFVITRPGEGRPSPGRERRAYGPWSIQAEGIVIIRSEDSTTFQKFALQPGIPFVWNKLQLTLASTITPNLPLLSSYFITDDKIVSRIDPSPQGHPLPNPPGQLQCKTKEDAITFKKCIFEKHACSCTPREYTAHCSCPNGTMSSFLYSSHNKLPITTNQVTIINEKRTIKAKSTIGFVLTVQLSMNDLCSHCRQN
ncbi:unnamed protein product [Nippostrongylus brasiliensis]|uniref:Phlebovirus_G2 domain-containing protein n=1 Tax=Nippostrongylus brasiliensis TaxID=27835 RepID=A0A0N4YDC5_NIPBR|nr:unnamed protein product [Nippostrongylus brasiliensis]